jgi:hypothetical protein
MCPFLLDEYHSFEFLSIRAEFIEPFFHAHPSTPVVIVDVDRIARFVDGTTSLFVLRLFGPGKALFNRLNVERFSGKAPVKRFIAAPELLKDVFFDNQNFPRLPGNEGVRINGIIPNLSAAAC